MRRFVSFAPALLVLIAVVLTLFIAPRIVRGISAAETSARIVLAQQSLDDEDILERLNRATRAVAQAAKPSVVHLEVIPAGERGWRTRSSGAGWVWDDQGHIVTNAHVVRGAQSISIQFSDGRVVEPQLVRGETFLADPFTDIAILKVEPGDHIHPFRRATGLIPAQGDRVFAFGSPFGFKFSMSEGIVGGVGRDPQTASEFGGYTNYIQHDAAVNPGNSGGPLVDIKGRVLGMNVAIATGRDSQGTTGEGQSAGISFAIPLATIESVVTQLIETGDVARGFLGVQWGGRDESIAYQPDLKTTGIRIQSVETDGPAFRAGLKAGDIITQIAGVPVTNWAVLRSVITSSRPGSQIVLDAFRQGEKQQITVTLGELPRRVLLSQGQLRRELFRFGLIVADGTDGPRVRQVIEDSRAAAEGFKAGMRILSVGETKVSSFEELQYAMLDAGFLISRRVTLQVSESTEEGSGEPEQKTIQITR